MHSPHPHRKNSSPIPADRAVTEQQRASGPIPGHIFTGLQADPTTPTLTPVFSNKEEVESAKQPDAAIAAEVAQLAG